MDAGEQFLQLGVAGNVSPDIATARGATRVAVAWTGFRPGGTPNAYNLDIFYRLSEDGGWTWGEDVNISQFALEDTHRVYSDASAIFDGRDYLHVAFTTHYFDESTLTTSLQTGRIWHWDEVRDTITVVGDNWEEGDALPGAWHLNACRPSLAVDSVTGYFYCSYLWFDVDSYSGNGYYNGEAWVSVSADSGLHWSVGRNVTETSPPSPCAPGDCRSERDITLAERVTHTGGNAYLNLEWILDLDPGGIPQNEGVATLNTVFFQRIPADSIPLEPLMPWYAFHFGQNIPDTGRCCYGDPEDPECDVTTAAECLALGGNWNTDLDCETPCPVFVCTCEDEPNTHCALTAVPIPDGLFAGVDIPIVVPVRYHITDLNVCFDVTHPAVSQLVLSLISPASTEILLFNHDAGGADFRCTVLDDQATTPIGQGSAPFNGSFQPNAPLSTLNGEIAEGNWILHISDGVWGSAGTLNWACLNFEYDYIDAATDAPVPVEYSLSAFPNPFNPATTLTFGIQQPGDVRIDVFNIAGQQVRELANRHYDVGVHALTLDGKDLPSGIYFAQLRAGSFVKTEKLVLMK